MRIAIIGAGFTGSLLAVHLLRQSGPGVAIDLIERCGRFGQGLAYASANPNHLLNVRASNMSAYPDQPRHFVDWLAKTPLGLRDPDAAPETIFVERRTFGRYVGHCLAESLAGSAEERLRLLTDEVEALEEGPAGLQLRLAQRGELAVDAAVLATGHFPPAPPEAADPALFASPHYRADPWATEALADLDPAAPVLLLGTGLTAVDLVISLLDGGHRGAIHAVSRRGQLPQSHLPVAPWPALALDGQNGSLAALTRKIRAEIANAEECGSNWRAVLDALRPFTAALWQGWSLPQRRRFLRHLRPWWDSHRHRMAPQVARRIAEAQASGQLAIHAGKLQAARPLDERLEVLLRPRGRETLLALDAARLINCAGPSTDFTRIRDPLVRDLLDRGLVRPDPLGLGIEVGDDCATLDRGGRVSQRLFAAGPMTKGIFWEMTAVPDIRQQCQALAARLSRQCLA